MRYGMVDRMLKDNSQTIFDGFPATSRGTIS